MHKEPVMQLRAAQANDLELTYAITKDAMKAYIEQTWGRWDEAEQITKHADNFTPQTHRIILVGDAAAGLVAVEDFPTYVWLVKLYLLATHRGVGIGSQVLQGVIDAARAQGKPVQLRVLKVNMLAQALYARHGFKVIEESPERFLMQTAA